MSHLVDLSPATPHGFRGPPSTNIGVQLEVRVKPGYCQSAQATLSCHRGCHVESGLQVLESGEPIDAVDLDRVIGSAVVLDLTRVQERAVVDARALHAGDATLHEAGEAIRQGDIVLLRTDCAQRTIGTPRYFPDSPAPSEDAARWLVGHGPKCVGCDFFEKPATRDPGWVPEDFVVHRALLAPGSSSSRGWWPSGNCVRAARSSPHSSSSRAPTLLPPGPSPKLRTSRHEAAQ